MKKTINDIKKNYKSINGIVNNAYSGTLGDLSKINLKDFDNSLNFNLKIPFFLAKEFKTFLIKGSKKTNQLSSIVNISSIYAFKVPDPLLYNKNKTNPVNYGSTKASLTMLTKYLSAHLDSSNIRVNSVSPGPFPKIQKNKLFIKKLESKVLLKRVGIPYEVSKPVVFLLSNSSSYITGIDLIVDGGWTV